ncbi:MAG TPA: hypothetical protein VKP30_30690 [Polyangiaceae bacterium]|nr:hypothetical protein [Polyangiaceae bacterium]
MRHEPCHRSDGAARQKSGKSVQLDVLPSEPVPLEFVAREVHTLADAVIVAPLRATENQRGAACRGQPSDDVEPSDDLLVHKQPPSLALAVTWPSKPQNSDQAGARTGSRSQLTNTENSAFEVNLGMVVLSTVAALDLFRRNANSQRRLVDARTLVST